MHPILVSLPCKILLVNTIDGLQLSHVLSFPSASQSEKARCMAGFLCGPLQGGGALWILLNGVHGGTNGVSP